MTEPNTGPSTGPNSGPSKQSYFPGLDGLRGFAVIIILIFHADLGWLPGGFISLSIFFSLSGYLITSLLMKDLAGLGKIKLRRFWAKRARRLMPAATACVVAVCLWSLLSSTAQSGPSLRWDAVSALTNVANWRFAITGKSYADLFSGPSPLLHMWSLALEEQFYLFYPLLLALLWKLGLRRKGCAIVLGLLGVVSTLAAVFTSSDDIAYYGTHTRCAELLVGAVLSLLFHERLVRWVPKPRVAWAVNAAGLGVVALLLWISRIDDPTNHATIHGGLSLIGLACTMLVVSAMVPGFLLHVFSFGPLVKLGRLSYGIYLYHWPIFIWVESTKMGHRGVGTFAVEMALTLAAAVISSVLIENPIRYSKWPKVGARGKVGYVVALVSSLVLASSVHTVSAVPAAVDLAASGPPTIVTFTVPPPPVTDAPVVTEPPPPFTVLVLGSDAQLAKRLRRTASAKHISIIDHSSSHCPAIGSVAYTVYGGALVDSQCTRDQWEALLAANRPNAVVVGLSGIERLAYRLPDQTVVSVAAKDNDLRRAGLAEVVGFLDHLDVPTFVYDSLGTTGDFVATTIVKQVGSARSVIRLDNSAVRTFADELVQPGAVPPPTRSVLRVLVVGDSTAYALAAGLAEGSDGAFAVISAGVIRCPIVRATRTLGAPGVESGTEDCLRFDTDWARLVEAYDADVILAVDSLAEQWDQRFPGDDTWHAPGSPEYDTFHTSEAVQISASLEKIGVPLLIADAPQLSPNIGGYFGNDPQRVDAWNTVIKRWDASSVFIKAVPYAKWFSPPESDAGRSERPDGVHITFDFARTLTSEHLRAAIQTAYAQVMTDMKAQR